MFKNCLQIYQPIKTIFLVTIISFLIFTLPQNVFGLATYNSTYSGTVSNTTYAIKQMRLRSNGSLMVGGVGGLNKFAIVSADGNSVSSISYDVSLAVHSGIDFIVDGNDLYISISGTNSFLYKYSMSDSTINYVADIDVNVSGSSSLTQIPGGDLINLRGTTIKKYDTDLHLTASGTLLSTSKNSAVSSAGVLYYLTTGGLLKRSPSLSSSSESTLVSSLSSGSPALLTITLSSDGTTAYVAVSNTSATPTTNNTIRKYLLGTSTSDTTLLWSTTATDVAAIDINKTTGRIYWINTSGTIQTLHPINAPTAFSATASSSTSINLNWTSGVSDADFIGATIVRSTSSYPTSPTDGTLVSANNTSSTFSDTGLSPNTTYYYSIFNKTIDGYYNLTATTANATTAPSTPDLSASKPSLNSNTINLNWTVPAGTDSFRLTRNYNGEGEVDLDADIPSSTTTYSDTGLEDGSYVYKVYSTNILLSESTAGTSSTIIIDTTAPSSPTLSASKPSLNSSTINLTWDVPSDTNTFRLTRNYNGLGETELLHDISNSTTSYANVSLLDGTYIYKIYAIDSFGNESNAGSSSTLTVDTTAPSSPSSFIASASSTTVNLSWVNPVSDFSSVTIRRSSSTYPVSVSSGDPVLSGSISTSYSNTGLSDDTYYYSIFAIDSYNNASLAAHATTQVDTTSPPSPTSFSTSVSGMNIHLNWINPVSDFASVTIRRSADTYPISINSGDLVVENLSTTSYSDSVTTDGLYYYSIFAKDSFGNVSAAANATATVDTTPPSAPTSASATASGANVNLSWVNPISDFSSITIRRSHSTVPLSINQGDAVIDNLSTSTYSDTGLSDGTYYYSIFALDSFLNVSSPISVTVVINTSAPTLTTLAASSLTQTSALLNANLTDIGGANPTERGFEYGSTTSYGSNSLENGSFSTGSFSGSLTHLSCGSTYHYRAYAINSYGTNYGSDNSFQTSSCNSSVSMTVSIDSSTLSVGANAYYTLEIQNTGGEDISSFPISLSLSDNQTINSIVISSQTNASLVVESSITPALDCNLTNNTANCDLNDLPANTSLSLQIISTINSAGAVSITVSGDSEETTSATSATSAITSSSCSLEKHEKNNSDNFGGYLALSLWSLFFFRQVNMRKTK